MAQEARLRAVITAEDRASGVLVRASSSTGKLQTATTRLQGAVLGLAGAYIGAQGLSSAIRGTVGAAIDYESAFAGVRKTVDASEEQLQKLSNRFREMSREMPITANEFARIGELAGQLGVQAEDIDKFAETVAKIGATTNLSTEEAATGFARMANIMNFPIDQVDKLGSVIVDLGNNMATTESEIQEMALRLAGAGQVVGLSTQNTLGLAAALSSVGIRAEAGGSAVSRTMIKISQAVSEGGDTIKSFSEIAGSSSQEFSRQWSTNPVEALLAFVEGLSKAQDEGKDLFGILGELGITEIRERDAILRLAGARGLVNEAMEISNEAFEKNNALNEEFQKRAQTTASQIQILKNNFSDLGIEIGSSVLPIINKFVSRMSEGIRAVRDISQGLEQTGFERGVGSVADTIHRLRRPTGGLLSGILGFADGGVVPGPRGKATPAIVHGGETVLPEGVEPVTININNPVVREDQDIERISRKVYEAISRRNELAKLGAI